MKNNIFKIAIITVSMLAVTQAPAGAVSITPSNNATAMANSILGTWGTLVGTPTLVASYESDNTAPSAGFFSDGLSSGLDFNSGVVLSSGDIRLIPGPNSSIETSTVLGLPGDTQLQALVSDMPNSDKTYDVTALTFDFITGGGSLYFNFIFGSEEYNEMVNEINDVCAIFLDNQNIALVPGTTSPVSIYNVNNSKNSAYYVDNTSGLFNIELDGLTTGLTSSVINLNEGIHTIKFAIADEGDGDLDSALFIRSGVFSPTPAPEPSSMILGLMGLASIIGLKKKD